MSREYNYGNVRILIEKDYETMSLRASEFMVDQVRSKPDSLLTIATGSTPEGMYARFCETVKKDSIPTDDLRFHKLDEWQGLKKDDPATCEVFVRTHILNPLNIREEQYWGVDSEAADPEAECRRIASRMRQEGPLDLCILGLGANGHLGLNEPAEFLSPYTHVAPLTEKSMTHTMLGTAEQPVRYGLTTGMSEILGAGLILFLVSGKHKARQFSRFMTREISTSFPASFLWLHSQVICICDEDAAAMTEQWEE